YPLSLHDALPILDEAALDLAKVDRRVQRMADIVEDIDGNDPVFASERVDHNLAERRTIGEIEEGAAGMGGAVVMDLRRRVEAGCRERNPGEMGPATKLGEAPVGRAVLLRGESIEPLFDRLRG